MILDDVEARKTNEEQSTAKIVPIATSIIELYIKEIEQKMETLLKIVDKIHQDIKTKFTKETELINQTNKNQQTSTQPLN